MLAFGHADEIKVQYIIGCRDKFLRFLKIKRREIADNDVFAVISDKCVDAVAFTHAYGRNHAHISVFYKFFGDEIRKARMHTRHKRSFSHRDILPHRTAPFNRCRKIPQKKKRGFSKQKTRPKTGFDFETKINVC